MKPIKNLRGFLLSLRRSGLFGEIEVVGGIVYARSNRDYSIVCDIIRHDYLATHRVSYLRISLTSSDKIVIEVKFYV